MKKPYILILCFILPLCFCKRHQSTESQSAQTTCSSLEYTQKSQSVTDSVTLLKEKDPEKYKEAVSRMQIIADQLRQNPNDLSSACHLLDELTTFLQ